MNNPTQIQTYQSEGATASYRIVKHGSADELVAQSAAGTDANMGVSDSLGGDAGGRIDVIKAGTTLVEYGGAITRGDELAPDADGKAVKAAAGDRIVGTAEVSGVSGDLGSVHIAFSTKP